MFLYLSLRRARHLSTIAAVAEPITAKIPNISEAKKRLRKVYDLNDALRVYSFARADDAPALSTSTCHIQELADCLLAKSHCFDDIEAFLEFLKSQPQITEVPFVFSHIKSYKIARMIDNALTT